MICSVFDKNYHLVIRISQPSTVGSDQEKAEKECRGALFFYLLFASGPLPSPAGLPGENQEAYLGTMGIDHA